ncbi:protein kinase family protein [Lentzea sp. NEAU-D13]|uniref:Protein kinase family protein n=1 Tax=Lentzea alba TaxID=2714351 RepID=A0A7C9W2R7_9PSEU|nr:protein kinase family protein [Lentzea alba]NGY63577.1 protein kinase family protein [Lentzea alba]
MTRLHTHATLSAALSRLGDQDLSDLLERAEPGGAGIGGPTALLEVGGTPVFVKRLPLTDLELRPEHIGSTANLFDLPVHTHYGVGLIGAAGFGAWRELAAHTMTTNWVLQGEHDGFPLMYHWRVLPHPGQTLPEELDQAVDYWGPEIGPRIEALRASKCSIALFLEYFPHNLHDWLNRQDDLETACEMVERELAAGVEFMNSQGLLHFDGHFQNVLTDGERLYFADYGLAISSEFDLSEEEIAFFTENQDYDRAYTVTHLVMWFAYALRYQGVPPRVAAILNRHNEVAAVMKDFYRRFQHESRRPPYPAADLRSVR